jgi:AraC family transcriptional regulator, transcriptional activator of pobA
VSVGLRTHTDLSINEHMEIIHQTLEDFFKRMGLPMTQDTEMTVHRLDGLHGDKPIQSPLFRTNYYSFLLITGGTSMYTIDDFRFDLGENSFYFTNPGHLKSFQIEVPLQGYMLTFTERFVQQFFVGDFFQQFPFLINETIPVLTLDKKRRAEIELIFQMLLNEYDRMSPFRSAIMVNQLIVLLYKTKELLLTSKAIVSATNRPAELVTSFKNIISAHFKDLATGKTSHLLSVKEISNQLNIHPNYLTNLVKTETGKSATDFIQERTISEAKAFLSNTNQTISEIAFALGFTDSTHFAKFFKKNVGVAPGAFRNL